MQNADLGSIPVMFQFDFEFPSLLCKILKTIRT